MASRSPAPSQGTPSTAHVFRPFNASPVVDCPICGRPVHSSDINAHLDASCGTHVVEKEQAAANGNGQSNGETGKTNGTNSSPIVTKRPASSFFQTPAAKRQANGKTSPPEALRNPFASSQQLQTNKKRRFDDGPGEQGTDQNERQTERQQQQHQQSGKQTEHQQPPTSSTTAKRSRTQRSAPLAERMRPRTLDEVFGQELVGPSGVLRALIESDRVPSMILWGGSGTGKTTIARCIAQAVGSRFVEMNATSSGGVAECKKVFQEAGNELALTGRKTILFCDEIHRFTKAQQDVFLKPVEAGTITLIGATTENPSFRVVNALLSRCRTFTLAPLTRSDITRILRRAVEEETGFAVPETNEGNETKEGGEDKGGKEKEAKEGETKEANKQDTPTNGLSPLIDDELLTYLAAFADGDARTALNLLELALSMAARPKDRPDGTTTTITKKDLKTALTKTLVYDRAGDQHYDTISAFHKSVRGSDPDATLYYLARMLQSGEDPLFVARRMVVIASEDVGLADSTLLPLATATYTAAQQIGMPECRIPLAHCAVALAMAPKSTRSYRGLNNAMAALREPGVASLPIPIHLRNAPTRLMKEMGYGAEYKYNPNYVDGRVRQDYLPTELLGRTFLEARDLGTEVDPDL